jgi:tetratricopeptide (TPR) repeat protein
MKTRYLIYIKRLSIILWIGFLCSCTQEFLDIKRDKTQVIPVSLRDYGSLLGNTVMQSNNPVLGEVGSDDYFVTLDVWNTLSSSTFKNAYIWADEIFEGESSTDWNKSFERIMICNFVLDGIKNMEVEPEELLQRNHIRGEALYFRGLSYYLLAQVFCAAYDASGADQNLGLPLRTSSNINMNVPRSSLQETFNFIINDLQQALLLLPVNSADNTHPGRAASHGTLASVYHYIQDYDKALLHADSSIFYNPQILDYNTLNVDINAPFGSYGKGNPEILLYLSSAAPTPMASSRINIDSGLLNSYEEYDLRKKAFFTKTGNRDSYKTGYTGVSALRFMGFTSTEMYLIRAECLTRKNSISQAISDMEFIAKHRYTNPGYKSYADNIQLEELMDNILLERRKELVYRGKRWGELKRLSLDSRTARSITRKLGDNLYTLNPGENKWLFPIPSEVVRIGGLEQNPR